MLSERLQPPCVPEGTAAVSTSAGLGWRAFPEPSPIVEPTFQAVGKQEIA